MNAVNTCFHPLHVSARVQRSKPSPPTSSRISTKVLIYKILGLFIEIVKTFVKTIFQKNGMF